MEYCFGIAVQAFGLRENLDEFEELIGDYEKRLRRFAFPSKFRYIVGEEISSEKQSQIERFVHNCGTVYNLGFFRLRRTTFS